MIVAVLFDRAESDRPAAVDRRDAWSDRNRINLDLAPARSRLVRAAGGRALVVVRKAAA